MKLNILTAGFETPNARAFLFPFIVYEKQIKNAGIEFDIFTCISGEIYECDILAIDSKFHKFRWKNDEKGVLSEFENFKKNIKKVIYFDTTDSTGFVQKEVFPFIDKYAKAQILKDKSLYKKPMYGYRIFADYYHRNYGIVDERPSFSQAIEKKEDLDKICVSWNSSTADYSVLGPTLMALYYRFPCKILLSPPKIFTPSKKERTQDLHCRMGVNYPRESVAFQRKQIREKLGSKIPTNKVKRFEFFKEMQNSKIILSPFGLGEITLKDFEAFICGGLLMKADMSHMETWPNLYQKDETYLAYKWDLSDLEEKINHVLDNYDDFLKVAQKGQDFYKKHINKKTGSKLFIEHLKKVFEY